MYSYTTSLFIFLYKCLGLKIKIYTLLHTHPKKKRVWLTSSRKDSKTLKSIDLGPLCPCFDIVIGWSCTSLPLSVSFSLVPCVCHHCSTSHGLWFSWGGASTSCSYSPLSSTYSRYNMYPLFFQPPVYHTVTQPLLSGTLDDQILMIKSDQPSTIDINI